MPTTERGVAHADSRTNRVAIRFGLLIGVLSFFADFTYEGSRSNLGFVLLARLLYPRPQDLESAPPDVRATGLPRVFWIYLAGAALVAAGFADYRSLRITSA